ncbi:hypothetical protein FSP39_021009 [Pinctada imbricata]|uniref:Serine/threonine-protein kinase receptor n=1 Tax=Pinctada imbricata TaxID=66713 RepID=A0AA89C2R4_PINIB|nr:hypothetical protein FSP39_021009 [Pinctada imbricata]
MESCLCIPGIELIKQGCWTHQEMCESDECVQTSNAHKKINFCCCRKDLCNVNITAVEFADSTTKKPSTVGNPIQALPSEDPVAKTLMVTLVPISAVVIFIVVGFFLFRYLRKEGRYMAHQQLPILDPELSMPESLLPHKPIQLLEIRAHGRFGEVWKAKMEEHDVAVKIMPFKEKASWLAEQEIYNLPHMAHDNILLFVGAEKHEENLWLITQFHEKGSLCEYLKGNTITWSQLCKMAETMSRGLAYLHDEIPGGRGTEAKPAIAHRDFKSKNVLLKDDLSACIADFGLALKFEPGKSPGETHGLVGTRRYMAPEILEGAISFKRDAFLRIDMYACGLVLWELVTRCSCVDGPIDEYQLPFEEEVGSHPTLEDLQDLVVMKKVRPSIKEHWQRHAGLDALISTIEECWDQDAEARVSAVCVNERMNQLTRTLNVSNSSENVTVTSNQGSYYINSVST